MLFATSLALGASLLPLTEAITLSKRTDGPARVVALDTVRRRTTLSAPIRDRLRKRDNTLLATLDNEGTLYFANVTLGTPAQSLRLDIDTGSSDLWTNSATSDLCTQDPTDCATSGTYNANTSTSYEYVNSAFLIRYADGSTAQGDYGTDTLTIGGTSLTAQQFGIGYTSTSAQGILGVGYTTNEAAISTTGKTYPNVPAQMVTQGKISTTAYSLWLNDLDANTGSILFGGVDTDKYTGELATLPIIKENGVYQEFIIGLSSLSAGGESIFANDPVAVLLDSGSSLSYLPDSAATAIYSVFSATYDSQGGAATIDCSMQTSTATVDFSFSGFNISVPMNELVLVDGYQRGKEVCILGISSAGSSTPVLGDTFLRSAYVVYDLDNNEISLAQTDFNATSSNVKEITSGSAGVPGATAVANAVTSLAVGTGGARNGGNPSVTAIGSGATATGMPLGKYAVAAAAGLAFAL